MYELDDERRKQIAIYCSGGDMDSLH